MKFMLYLEEKIFFLLFQIFFLVLLLLFFSFFEIPRFYFYLFGVFFSIFLFLSLIFEYLKEAKSYKQIVKLVDDLEDKYLIAEILNKPKKVSNQAYYYALKCACKAMNDKVSQFEMEKLEYREYVESFGHEAKTPIAALSLLFENEKNVDAKIELDKINNYIEQMLFYARSDVTEKDYFVKKLNLEEIVHTVLLHYKDYLLKKKIILEIHDLKNIVYADEKWLIFILEQIIQNAIKYVDKKNKQIEIWSEDSKNNCILYIKDNGCGIKQADLMRVFEKGFTGSKRNKKSATGMGLYLSHKLCSCLGLSLFISSKENCYTQVEIVFPKSSMHDLK